MTMSKTGFFTAGLASLKPWVIIAHLVSWNIFFGIAIYLNGLGPIKNPMSLLLTAIICCWTAIFFLSVPLNEKVRNYVLSPNRTKHYNAFDFYLVGFICSALTIGALIQGYMDL